MPGRRARDDAVIIVGEAGGFHQGMMAALRAAHEIGFAGFAAIEILNNGFRRHGRDMQCAIGEVDHLLRMAQGPALLAGAVGRVGIGDMAIVGGHGGIARLQRRQHGLGRDRPRRGAGALGLEFAVPGKGRRHPDLEADAGIRAGLRHADHPAQRRIDAGLVDHRTIFIKFDGCDFNPGSDDPPFQRQATGVVAGALDRDGGMACRRGQSQHRRQRQQGRESLQPRCANHSRLPNPASRDPQPAGPGGQAEQGGEPVLMYAAGCGDSSRPASRRSAASRPPARRRSA